MRKVILETRVCSSCKRVNYYDHKDTKDFLIHCTFCTMIINRDEPLVEAIIE